MKVVVGYATVIREVTVTAHRYETASAYDRLRLTPGVYELYKDTAFLPYVCRARIDATRVEHFYVNRLLVASSIDRDTTERPDHYDVDVYDYQIRKAGGELALHDGALLLSTEPVPPPASTAAELGLDPDGPVHEHDCDGCEFLGRYEPTAYGKWHPEGVKGYDLYVCEHKEGRGSLVARNGIDGDYLSRSFSPVEKFRTTDIPDYPLDEAWRRRERLRAANGGAENVE